MGLDAPGGERMSALGFHLHISLNDGAMQTPEDIAAALRALAEDMDNRTAGAPSKPITMGPSTRIAGNVRDHDGAFVGSWSVTK